jgi:hypothetical protein
VKMCSKLLRLIRRTSTVRVNLGLVYKRYTPVSARYWGLLDTYSVCQGTSSGRERLTQSARGPTSPASERRV